MRKKYPLLKSAIAILFIIIAQTLLAQDVQDSQKALSLVKKNAAAIGLSNDDLSNARVSDTYTDDVSGAVLVYLQQTYKGIDVDKSVQVLAFKNETLVSSSGKRQDLNPVKGVSQAMMQKLNAAPSVAVEEAIKAAAQHLQLPSPSISKTSFINGDYSRAADFGDLGIAKESVSGRLMWIPDKTFQRVKLVWEINISPKGQPDSWRVMVDAKAGSVIKKENYTVYDNFNKPNTSNTQQQTSGSFNTGYSSPGEPQKKPDERITSVTYRVVPFPAEASDFPGGSPALSTDPWKLSPEGSWATPFIWNDDGSRQYTFTKGNNVLAQEDQNADNLDGKRAIGTQNGNNLYFDFMPDFTKDPTDSINQGFAITNLFYWNNIMHDLSYQYGFDEVSGNFQQNNLGRGGKGYDYVYADAQDGSGLNNANFGTPPDGKNPRMQMYLFVTADPLRDGDVDNGVICHEYTHGISTRLTGGPSNVACLFNAEEMGEGWSDYISMMTTTDWSKAHNGDGKLPRPLGTYVLNEPNDGPGIRRYPYSTDMSIDPHTYTDIANGFSEVHDLGEIWATILWDMTWDIIQVEGINKDIFNAAGAGGNSTAYKLVLEGMKLQPCSPGFVDGRDAILKADSLLYNGAHSCIIWKAFARRGVGIGASQGSSDIAGDEIANFDVGAVVVTKHAPKTTSPGKEIEYTIGLKAKAVCGGTVKQNYWMTDSLPANVTYVSSDGSYNAATRTVTFKNIDMNDGDSLTYKMKVKVNDDAWFPDSVYLNDPAITPVITDKWDTRDGDSLAWGTLNLGTPDFPFYIYYSNDALTKDNERLVTASNYFVPGEKTTFSFFHEYITYDYHNGGVIEITTDSGKIWQDLGPYMDPLGVTYNETIYYNSILYGRKAFSGFGLGVTTIDLSSFAGKTVKIRFLYASSKNSFAYPDGGTGWIMDDILLSATPLVTNTVKLYRKDMLTYYSTSVTQIKGSNVKTDFYVSKRDDDKALLTWQRPGELKGAFNIERSTDKGVTFKTIGTVNVKDGDDELQSYDFSDASPAEGINLYRIQHTGSSGTVNYSEAKAAIFNKAIRIYPNPAKDKLNISIPGNNKTITLQLTDALGHQIKSYKVSGQQIELKLPPLSSGGYYLNVIKADGTSKHKIVIE